MEQSRFEHLLIFGLCMAVVWFIVIYFLPRMLISVYKRAILVQGFGDGPIPVNTLYMQPQARFSDPIHASGSRLAITGVNRDTLITIGWLDLRGGAQILHVPDMAGRYYSVQFTDPSRNTIFACIGKRTTGTGAGSFLIGGPGWKAATPGGLQLISSPSNSVLVIGRILVESDSDLPMAYGLAKQIRLSRLPS